MYSSFASVVSVGFSLLQALVPLFGAVFIASKVTGSARSLGLLGCILLVLSGLMQTLYFFLLPRLVRAFEGMGVIAVVSGLANVISLIGLALVIAAVCAGRRTPTPPVSYPR